MSDRLKALREQRATAIKKMRDIVEAAEKREKGKQDLSAEELGNHDAAFKEADGLRAQIDALERTVEAERQAADQAEREGRSRKTPGDDTPEKRQMKSFRKFLLGGVRALTEEEVRTLQAGSDTEGGYLRPPQEFIAELIRNVDDQVVIRKRATKYQLAQAESLGVPTLDTDLDDADWTTELQTGNEDTAMRFGKRELRPHPFAKRIKVSKKLIRSSALPIETIVNQRMAYKSGITEEKGYLTGNGNQRPLGVFTASNDGIPTSRDVSAGNAATYPTFDGLMAAKYSVKAAYWPKASWLFHRDAIKLLVQLKDGNGQYIWRDSVSSVEPDKLLNAPIDISEFAPNTFTTGLYVGLFGDFSWYWIADSLDMTVQRLVELYAESNQDGFILRKETDGMPVLAEAFARVKLG